MADVVRGRQGGQAAAGVGLCQGELFSIPGRLGLEELSDNRHLWLHRRLCLLRLLQRETAIDDQALADAARGTGDRDAAAGTGLGPRRLRDINADSAERLTTIAHIDDERAVQLISGRPWPSVRSLTGINGIGRGRIRDILEQDLACVGVRAPRGQRETRTIICEANHQLIKIF